MFFTNPVLLLAALGSGATQFVTYGLGNFAVLFLMREKGMTLQPRSRSGTRSPSLIGMGGGMIVSGRVIDRLTRRSRSGYAIAPGDLAGDRAALLPRASSGRRPGRWRWRCSPS